MWTTTTDVRSRWVGPDPIPDDEAVLATLIDDAEDTILREFPDLQDRIDDESLPVGRVVKVVCRMVIRHLRNPAGIRSEQDSAGPFAKGRTFGGQEPGSLSLSDADRADLSVPGVSSRKAFVIDLMPVASE